MTCLRLGVVGVERSTTESLLGPPILKTSLEGAWKALISAPPSSKRILLKLTVVVVTRDTDLYVQIFNSKGGKNSKFG
jgi:hypothetical protein